MVKKIYILVFLAVLSFSSYSQANKWAGFGYRSTTTVDSNAQRYIDSSAMTDATHKTALIGLVKNLKDSTLWATTVYAFYPYDGGTFDAAHFKYNLISVYPINSSFCGTFSGGWTFSDTAGAVPNGTNAYMDTHFIPNTNASPTGFTFGQYSRTQSVAGGDDGSGCYNGGGAAISYNNIAGGIFYNGDATGHNISYTASPTTKFLGCRKASTTLEIYRNGVSLGSSTNVDASLCTYSFYFGARNTAGSAGNYSPHKIGCAVLAGSMTDAQFKTLTNIINIWIAAISRTTPF